MASSIKTRDYRFMADAQTMDAIDALLRKRQAEWEALPFEDKKDTFFLVTRKAGD